MLLCLHFLVIYIYKILIKHTVQLSFFHADNQFFSKYVFIGMK